MISLEVRNALEGLGFSRIHTLRLLESMNAMLASGEVGSNPLFRSISPFLKK
jgi:hypothetical protein